MEAQTLLVSVERLGENGIAGKDHDNRKVLVNESKDTVLQFTGHDCFTVKIGDLLNLKCTCL